MAEESWLLINSIPLGLKRGLFNLGRDPSSGKSSRMLVLLPVCSGESAFNQLKIGSVYNQHEQATENPEALVFLKEPITADGTVN